MNKADVLMIIDVDRRITERMFKAENDAGICNPDIAAYHRGYMNALKNIKEAIELYDEN